MAAYLIVDVVDLLQRFTSKGISLDLQELAVGLRGGAALAAGLFSADSLKAVPVANSGAHGTTGTNFQRIFRSAGYDVFDMPRRETLADALIAWHQTATGPADAQQWFLDLAALQAAPTWRFGAEYAERWRRYAHNLGRLQELAGADAPAAAELRDAIAADEAWLDLEFRRRPAPANP